MLINVKFVLFFLVVFTFSCNLFSGENPWLKTRMEKALKKPECMVELDKKEYINTLNDFRKLIEHGYDNGQPIRASQFMGFAAIVKQWMSYKYIELDTNMSKKWFKKLIKIYKAMYLYAQTMDRAEREKNTKLYDAAKKKYKAYYKLLVKTVENPERPKSKVKQALQIQKVKEYKAYRKYLEKQEEIENADPR